MKFRLPYENTYDSPASCCGEKTKPVYTLVNSKGERSLKQIDTIDLPEYINSFEEMTDIRAMLKKYALTGDISLFNQKGGALYADVSTCETDYASLLNRAREIALLKLQSSQTEQALSSDEADAAQPGADASQPGADAAQPQV